MKSKDPKFGMARLIDANVNRAKEGLRVCEDIFRFVKDDRNMTRALKDLRHDVTQAVGSKKIAEYMNHRQIEKDVGKASTANELKRINTNDVLFANLQRSKESVRVLEEMFKLTSSKTSNQFKQIRYKLYAIEKRILKKI